MTDILAEICDAKRQHVATCKKRVSLAELESRTRAADPIRGFKKALNELVASRRPALIAEIKKASPSAGLIRANFDPARLAADYAEAGAACLSVLTDQPYFQGEDRFLGMARAACALPVLRKDFMVDPYQIVESRALGADAVLLIMAALSDMQAAELEATATQYGMDVLVEVHDAEEMNRAAALRSRLIGINNRNLKTMQVDLATSETLARMAPTGSLLVCESGIGTHADILRMHESGIYAFLVGESLMRQADLSDATRRLLGVA